MQERVSSLSAIRRRAGRENERIWKVRESSRDYSAYGPFAVVSLETTGIVAKGLDLEDLTNRYRR